MLSTLPYDALGGQDGIRALVDRFYELMDELPEARAIRRMHPRDLTESREKLALFLIGRFGGPPLYMERYGHPRLRMRHMRFPIDQSASDAWVLCMDRALVEQVPDERLRAELGAFFKQVADFMRNRA